MEALETLQSSPHQVDMSPSGQLCIRPVENSLFDYLTASLFLFLSLAYASVVNLMFLMSYWTVNRSTLKGVEALQMALHTLRKMALGGIHDHIAQV